MSYDILAVSDISLGYGSPQIIAFLQSMAKFYDCQAYVIETDEPHRPPTVLKNTDRLTVHRSISAQQYWCLSAHIERNFEALEIAKEHKPHTIILFSPLQLPFVKNLPYKPAQVILYLLEIDAVMYARAMREYAGYVDYYIFPEYERMRYILGQVQRRPYPKSSLLFNCVEREEGVTPKTSDRRNGKIAYAGTLSRELTLAHEFLEAPLKTLPLDIFGNFSGFDAVSLRDNFQNQREKSSTVQYRGYVPNSRLRHMLAEYAFSFVRWNPDAGINYRYACPNKFFEAITMGVPPIAAPHPQCLQIINTYECGILADDFSSQGMYKATKFALNMLGSSKYDRMVERCLAAYEEKFCWSKQFEIFSRSLPSINEMNDRKNSA